MVRGNVSVLELEVKDFGYNRMDWVVGKNFWEGIDLMKYWRDKFDVFGCFFVDVGCKEFLV